ncbi:MAG: hypothetical protein JWN03_5224 [Nocardia sp.]|uniref:hypothetical protein n=1 Tax=Nocardia sp. TaxID=1821 RepID=UPI00262ECA7C|nr:hypothetical protein [Nocardia sp.]MCU1644949.1 hypothetical protein [Nocardia sp.]
MNSIEPNRDDHASSGGADLVPLDGSEVAVPETTDYIAVPVQAHGGIDPEAQTEFIAVPVSAADDSGATGFVSDDAYMDAVTEIIVLPYDLAAAGVTSSAEVDNPGGAGDLEDDADAVHPGSRLAALWQRAVGFVAERDLRKQLPRVGAIAALLSLVIGGVFAFQAKGDDRVGNVMASDDSMSSSTDELTTQLGPYSTADLSSTFATPSDAPVPTDIASTDVGLPPAPGGTDTGVPSTDIPPTTDTSVTDTSTIAPETMTTTTTTTTDQPTVSVSGSFSVQLPPWTGLNQDPATTTTTTVTVFVPTSDSLATTPPVTTTTTPPATTMAPVTTTPPVTTTAPVTTVPPVTTTAPVTTTSINPSTTPPPTNSCSTTPLVAKTTKPTTSQPTISRPPSTTPPRPSTTTKPPASSKPSTTPAKPTTTRPCG